MLPAPGCLRPCCCPQDQPPACPRPPGNVVLGTELAHKPFPWVRFVGRLCKGFDVVARIHSDIMMFSALNHRFP